MRVLDDSIQVQTFDDAAALKAHYRNLARRRYEPRLVKPEPAAPVVRTIDVAEAKARRALDAIVLPIARPRPDYVPTERDWLKVATGDQPETTYTVRQLACIVGKRFDILLAEILSERRQPSITYARHASCWLAKRFTPLSLPQIGKQLGGRDHTTVLHAASRIQRIVDRLNITPSEETPEAWAEALYAAQPKWGQG
jgi:hypothetical protein